MIIILTGVSGVGKTTVAQILEEKYDFKRSVSYTTRTPRSGEIDGIDYNFITKQKFKEKITNEEFLEYVEQFDNFYGSGYCDIEENKNTVMCLTKEGFLAAKKKWSNLVVGIYLIPPKPEVLKERIKLRNTNDLDERMQAIYKTVDDEKDVYDVLIHPDILEKVLDKILLIIKQHTL